MKETIIKVTYNDEPKVVCGGKLPKHSFFDIDFCIPKEYMFPYYTLTSDLVEDYLKCIVDEQTKTRGSTIQSTNEERKG